MYIYFFLIRLDNDKINIGQRVLFNGGALLYSPY